MYPSNTYRLGLTETKPSFARLILLLLFFGFLTTIQAQDKVDILDSDEILYNEKLYGKQQILIGNVKLRYDGSLLFCDKAFLLENSNGFKAIGHVRINQGDTLFLRSQKADYTSLTKIAIMRDSVELEDDDLLLKGPKLTYNRTLAEAFYTERSKIFVKSNGSFIESNFGHYYKNEKRINFTDSVIYRSKDLVLEGNSLDYFTETEQIIYNEGATTTRLSDSATFYSDKAIYFQKEHLAYFSGNVKVNQAEVSFRSDSLFFNDSTNIAIGYNKVQMIDTLNDWLLKAPYAESYRDKDSVSVPFRNELVFVNNQDSIHLFSDSLRIFGNDSARKVLATGRVKISGRQFQGSCDSLVYIQKDSTITLFNSPVLWQDSSQIVGNKITLFIGDKGIKRMYIPKNAFITEKMGDELYNQIKGRELNAFFVEGSMRNILIEGNGQSIYHAFDEKTDSLGAVSKTYIGVNLSECSNMEIIMRADTSGISTIKFLTKPDNQLKPAATLGSETFYLDAFQWLFDQKPMMSKEQSLRILDLPTALAKRQEKVLVPMENEPEKILEEDD